MHFRADEKPRLYDKQPAWRALEHTVLGSARVARVWEKTSDLLLVMQALVIIFEIWCTSTLLFGLCIILIHDMAGQVFLPEWEASGHACISHVSLGVNSQVETACPKRMNHASQLSVTAYHQ